MHFQCKCQQFVRASEGEAKQMLLHCYCYGTGIHQSAAEYLQGNLLALLHTSEMHGNVLKYTDVGFREVILSDQIFRLCVLVYFHTLTGVTLQPRAHVSSVMQALTGWKKI